jgi:hypothetical protein
VTAGVSGVACADIGALTPTHKLELTPPAKYRPRVSVCHPSTSERHQNIEQFFAFVQICGTNEVVCLSLSRWSVWNTTHCSGPGPSTLNIGIVLSLTDAAQSRAMSDKPRQEYVYLQLDR